MDIRISATNTKAFIEALDFELTPDWCDSEPNTEGHGFLCYPDDGQCTCGTRKHHVHCQCGKILQIG